MRKWSVEQESGEFAEFYLIITPSAMPPGTTLFINFTDVGTPNWVISMGVQHHAEVNLVPASCLTSSGK